MIVYHGSDSVVENIDLKKCHPYKDFGKGFYVTTDKNQAVKFSKLVARKNGKSKGYVSSYEMSDCSKLRVIEFKTTNKDWLNCVVGYRNLDNRNLKDEYDDADIIIGKIADDDTAFVINAYTSGVFGEIGSDEAVKMAVKRFVPEKLKDQLCFKSKKAILKLKYINSEETYCD